ncbi:unnamed protein product [Clavelina lepadiformis]|uniref:Uncharacterized protein n=1 Tax=Clavelina lepadiformis TaxID=159417 RepID=A0ABP0FPF4_CLALP
MQPQTLLRMYASFLKWVALGLFVVAQVNVSWYVSEGVETGIFRTCNGTVCTSLGWDPNDKENLHNFVARIVMIGAAVFIAVGIIPHIYSWCADYEKRLALYKAEGALDIIGGLITLGGMVAYTVLIITLYTVPNVTEYWTFGWTYSLGWVSGTFYVIGGSFAVASGSMETSQSYPSAPLQSTLYDTTAFPGGGHLNSASAKYDD